MPDFIDRLLARSLPVYPAPQDTALVRPRLPQLFEGSGVDLQEQEITTIAARPLSLTTPAEPRPSVSAAGRQPDPVAQVGSPAVVRPVPQPNPVAPPREVPARPAPEQVEPASEPVPPAAEVIKLVTTARPEPAAVPVVSQAPQGIPVPPTPVRPPAAVPTEPPHQVIPLVRRREPEPRPQVVRVTIGRVEVTAAGPPAAPRQRPARPEPTVSLERYLAREDRRP